MTIARIRRHVKVYRSKQRPRAVTIVGSNGVAYRFLLKGHEDIRQDERAMQFFGLVNSVLGRSRACAREFVKAGGASALDKACAHNAYYRIGAAAHTRLFNMIFVSRVKRVIFCDNSCNNQKITFSFPKE